MLAQDVIVQMLAQDVIVFVGVGEHHHASSAEPLRRALVII